MTNITSDETHGAIWRIFGVPWPYLDDEAVPKGYVDQLVASTGTGGIIDGGTPTTSYVGGPVIDCGGIT